MSTSAAPPSSSSSSKSRPPSRPAGGKDNHERPKKRFREESRPPAAPKEKKDNNARNVKKKAKKRAKKLKAKKLSQGDGSAGQEEDEDDKQGDNVQTLLLEGHKVAANDDDDDEDNVKADDEESNKKKARNFTSDLRLYLELWKQHIEILSGNAGGAQYTMWKFNKVLQAWALDHCLDKEKVPLDLFKVLLGYIATVKGGARERLRDQMVELVQKADERTARHEQLDDEEQAELKRAKKVLVTIGKSDEAAQSK